MLPVVLAQGAGPWPFCFGLLSYLLDEEIFIKHKRSKQLDGELEGQNKQKEKVRRALQKLFLVVGVSRGSSLKH